MASVGILGGSFNPPHIGHLVAAQEARVQLGLDRVVLVPSAHAPHKRVPAEPGPQIRLELCRLAAESDSALEVDDVEVRRGGTSYTADTLSVLHQAQPDDELTFIVGGDMAATLPEWREPERVVSLARLAVAERAGTDRADVLAGVGAVEGAPPRTVFFNMPRLEVSSSDLRARIASGRPVRHLLPAAVASEIERRGLYATADRLA